MAYLIKLVRDRVGPLASPGFVTFGSVPREQHLPLLRRKLIEEAIEYLDDPSADELADVLQVVYDLCDLEGFTLGEVDDLRRGKEQKRGGFRHGMGMYNVNARDARRDEDPA